MRRLARERIGVSADRLIDERIGVAAMTETVKTAGFIAGAVALMDRSWFSPSTTPRGVER